MTELRRPACLNPSCGYQGYTLGGNQTASAVGSATCGRWISWRTSTQPRTIATSVLVRSSSQHPCCCELVIVAIAISLLLWLSPSQRPLCCGPCCRCRTVNPSQRRGRCIRHCAALSLLQLSQCRRHCIRRCTASSRNFAGVAEARVAIAESRGDLDPSKHGEPAAAAPPAPCRTSLSPLQP